jgi:HEAT repeat protein
MGKHAADAVPGILKLLGDLDEKVRWQAVMTLGNIGQHGELVVPRL